MCPRKEPVCISQAGSSRMLCRIGALDASLHGDSDLAPLRRDMPHRRHDRKTAATYAVPASSKRRIRKARRRFRTYAMAIPTPRGATGSPKGSVKPEPWVSWTFDEAKTLDYDLSGSLNIETQAYPRRSRSRSRRMVTGSRPRRASPVMAMLASGFLLLIAAVAVFAIRRAAQ